MAIVVMLDHTVKPVTAEQGALIWAILNGEQEPPDENWAMRMQDVADIYLNKHNAPASYLKAREKRLAGDTQRPLPLHWSDK